MRFVPGCKCCGSSNPNLPIQANCKCGPAPQTMTFKLELMNMDKYPYNQTFFVVDGGQQMYLTGADYYNYMHQALLGTYTLNFYDTPPAGNPSYPKAWHSQIEDRHYAYSYDYQAQQWNDIRCKTMIVINCVKVGNSGPAGYGARILMRIGTDPNWPLETYTTNQYASFGSRNAGIMDFFVGGGANNTCDPFNWPDGARNPQWSSQDNYKGTLF